MKTKDLNSSTTYEGNTNKGDMTMNTCEDCEHCYYEKQTNFTGCRLDYDDEDCPRIRGD